MRWEHPRGRGFVSARGTYLHFESGRHSLDASATGSWFTPLGGARWRGELGVAAGANQYADIASFSHAQVDTRVHLMEGDHGGWAGATFGRSSFGSGPRPVLVVAMGVWLLRTNKTMFVSLDRTLVGDTVYSDLRSSGRWQKDRFVLEGILGARFWSRGGGRGVFGEGSAILSVNPITALVLSGGRYPTDVVSGSIAGRYVSLAVRLGTTTIRRRLPAASPSRPHSSGSDGSASSPAGEVRLTIQRQQDDHVQLVLYAPGANTVEISGDFTDWRPVALSRSPGSFAAPTQRSGSSAGAPDKASSGVRRFGCQAECTASTCVGMAEPGSHLAARRGVPTIMTARLASSRSPPLSAPHRPAAGLPAAGVAPTWPTPRTPARPPARSCSIASQSPPLPSAGSKSTRR